MSKTIMGLQLKKRMDTAPQLQELLSEYGCIINTRLGVHQTSEDFCSENGLIILEFCENTDKQVGEFETKLKKLDGVIVKKMEF